MKTGVWVIIIVLLTVVGLGFFQYKQLESGEGGIGRESLSALTSVFSASLSSEDADMTQVNQLLSVLDQVSVLSSFDAAFFQSPAYISLRDFGVTLFPAKDIGRTNPFLEIGNDPIAPNQQEVTSSTRQSTTSAGDNTAFFQEFNEANTANSSSDVINPTTN